MSRWPFLLTQSPKAVTVIKPTKSDSLVFQFNRLHIPSGSRTIGEFDSRHDACFDYPQGYPLTTIQAIAMKIVNDWNRQQPTEWKYWI